MTTDTDFDYPTFPRPLPESGGLSQSGIHIPVLAASVAASAVLGYRRARKHPDRTRRVLKRGLVATVVVTPVMAVMFSKLAAAKDHPKPIVVALADPTYRVGSAGASMAAGVLALAVIGHRSELTRTRALVVTKIQALGTVAGMVLLARAVSAAQREAAWAEANPYGAAADSASGAGDDYSVV